MKVIVPLILLAFVAGFLARYNPDRTEFRAFVHEAVEEYMSQELGTERIGRIVTRFGTDVAASIAARSARREDYLLYSIYSVDLGADGRPEDQWRFLGIAGSFHELSRPDILR